MSPKSDVGTNYFLRKTLDTTRLTTPISASFFKFLAALARLIPTARAISSCDADGFRSVAEKNLSLVFCNLFCIPSPAFSHSHAYSATNHLNQRIRQVGLLEKRYNATDSGSVFIDFSQHIEKICDGLVPEGGLIFSRI